MAAPAWEETKEVSSTTAPAWNDTQDVAPAWDDTVDTSVQTGTDMLKRVPAGIAKASADAIVGASRLPNPLLDIVKAVPGGKELVQFGQEYFVGLGESAPSAYGVDESQNQTIPSKLISGVASIVPAIAAGPAAPVVIGGMMGEQSRQEAEAAGGTEKQKNIAFAGGAALGALSEALMGVPALLRSAKAAGIPEATFKAISKEAAVQALKGAAREGTQEGLEQVGQNLIASKIAAYDPERKTFAGVPEAIALGAAVGGPVGAVVQTASSLDAISAQAKATTAQVNATVADVAASEPPPVVPEAPTVSVVEPSIQGGEPNATQTGEIQQSSQPEREGISPSRAQAEAGSSDSLEEGGQEPQSIDDRIKSAYEEVVKKGKFTNVNISDLQKESGVPLQELHDWLRSNNENVDLSGGDPSKAAKNPPEVLAAGLPVQSEGKEAVVQLKVKLKDDFRQSRTSPEATTSTGQTAPTAEQPSTAAASTGVSPEGGPQGVATANLSAAQLEERIGIVLAKRSSAKTEAEKNQYLEEARSLTNQLMEAEKQSMGPGAAAATETLAQYAERRFGVRFGEDPRMAPELKEAAGNRYYEVLPNKVTAEEATDLIDAVGDDQAERMIRDNKSDASFAVRSTVGQILIQRLNQQYQQLKESNPQEAERVLNRAADLAEWQMDFGTRLGQGVQSFAMWMRLTPEGKLLGIKKAVRKARERHRQTNQKEVDEVLSVLGTEQSQEDKTRDMQRLGKKNKTARRVRNKLKKLTDKPQTAESFYDIASKDLGLPELTGEQELELRDLAGKVDTAAEGLPKWEAAKKFREAANRIKGFTATDFTFGYYYGNILSGAGTQIVNTVDTFLNIVHEANTMALANPEAAATIYSGLARGLANSKADAMLSLTKGRKISNSQIGESMGIMEESKFGEKGGVPIIGQRVVDRMAKTMLESKAAAPLNAWKYIGRLMSASDSVMFRGAQEARAGLLAYRIATEEGLTSSQRAKRVNEILGWDRLDEFMDQAKNEGYKGNEQAARATELMLMQRPEGLQQDASEFAGEATYNNKPRGILGFGSQLAGKLSQKYPAFRLIIPFTNIVANVFNRRLDNLPGVAMYRAKRGYYGSEEAGKNAVMRGYLSFGMINALLGMTAAGLIEITGPGPDDPDKKKQLRETGWKPYSIKAGKGYYSYANTPISLALGIIGNMMDWSRYKKASKKADKAFVEATVYSLFGLGSYLLSQSFISGLSNFFDMLGSNKGKAEFAVRNFVSQTASSFVPLTGLLKDVDSVFDDARRESKTMGAAVLSQIPFARFKGREALNAFGDPIKTGRIRPLARFVSREKDEAAWKVINEKQLRVPVPDPFFKTDDLNYEYQKQSGKLTKQWVLDNADTLRSLSSEDAQELLSESTANIRKGIRASILISTLK